MRFRQIKAHLAQFLLIGIVMYFVVYLLKSDSTEVPSLAAKFSEYQESKKKTGRDLSNSEQVDEIAQSMMDRLHESERKRNNGVEPLQIPNFNPPKSLLDTMLAQVPGGAEAIHRSDKVAVETMKNMIEKYKKNFMNSDLKDNALASEFAKHMFDGQKMLGPMPDIRNEPQFYDPERFKGRMTKQEKDSNILLVQQLSEKVKGNELLKERVLESLQRTNPEAYRMLLDSLDQPIIPPNLNSMYPDGLNDRMQQNDYSINSPHDGGVAQIQNDNPFPVQINKQDSNAMQINPQIGGFAQLGGGNIQSNQFRNPNDQQQAYGQTPNLQFMNLLGKGGVNQHELMKIQKILSENGKTEEAMAKLKALLKVGQPQHIMKGGAAAQVADNIQNPAMVQNSPIASAQASNEQMARLNIPDNIGSFNNINNVQMANIQAPNSVKEQMARANLPDNINDAQMAHIRDPNLANHQRARLNLLNNFGSLDNMNNDQMAHIQVPNSMDEQNARLDVPNNIGSFNSINNAPDEEQMQQQNMQPAYAKFDLKNTIDGAPNAHVFAQNEAPKIYNDQAEAQSEVEEKGNELAVLAKEGKETQELARGL